MNNIPDVFVDTKQSCKIPLNFDIDTSVSGIGWSETHLQMTLRWLAGYDGKNIQNELANNTKSDIKTLINLLVKWTVILACFSKTVDFLLSD